MSDKILLTFVEIDIPTFASGSPEVVETLRFSMDADYYPSKIAAIPSLIEPLRS